MKFEDYKHDAKIFLERKIIAWYLNEKKEVKFELLEKCLILAFRGGVAPSRFASIVAECDDEISVKIRISLP